MQDNSKGKQLTEIPMCVSCVMSCENDNKETLLKKAMGRIDKVDGGLSRRRFKARGQVTRISTQQDQISGDGPGDRVDSGTIANLHVRRSTTPGFVELDCVVPLDSTIYVSISDPLNTPSFKPSPTKPIPQWMQWLPGHHSQVEQRPHSILDNHFKPPNSISVQSPSSTTQRTSSPPMTCPSSHPGSIVTTTLPPTHHKSSDNLAARPREDSGKRPQEPQPVVSMPSPTYRQVSIVADEPLQRPSSRLQNHYRSHTQYYTHPHTHHEIPRVSSPLATPSPQEKGKSVAWAEGVAGGSSDEPRIYSKNKPQRTTSPIAAASLKVKKPRTPPAQSNEFIDLYRPSQAYPSLAVPGRRQDRDIVRRGYIRK
ncbi:hypothetical protein GGR57DRAFT_17767 [Xylariaceae sp. FL1272]|nr:hypothetical protein GGR57DRAFT_17767 [Xylariaceae sp. FL1272]